MRIGFEASSMVNPNPTGIVRYITRLISAISRELKGSDRVTVFYKLSRLRSRRHWWKPDGASFQVYHESYWPLVKRVDILHGLDGFVPNWKKVKRVVTFHDLVALTNDDISSQKFRMRKRKMCERVAQYVDAVVTVSEASRQDIIKLLAIPPEKVHVVYLGVEERFSPQDPKTVAQIAAKYGLRRDYLLFMGSVSERKNTERLVKAYACSKASQDLDLILAGPMAYHSEKTLQAITGHHLEHKVRILGFVTDNDLPALYSGAKGFVFPTFYEGFGLPILEAMACGVPVLIGNLGAAPEISGHCAIQVDPYDVDDIARGMDRLLETPPSQLQKSMKHAQGFTWERCAKQTTAIYSRLL